MTTTIRKTTTPTTGPGGNGRYKTKIERSLAILRAEGDGIPYPDFRRKYRARYGDDLGAHDTTFYRARNQVKAERFRDETVAIEAREQSAPNVAERPTVKQHADVPQTTPPEPEPIETTEPVALVSRIETLARKIPGSSFHDELKTWSRLPIISLAASMGGLLALRRAVDELIGGLAPELREGVQK